uniref:Mitochondrial import inner membrane translocase subunit TIM44 n=1 Tax=Schistocephalus solidus TaxID=70667 RepID=A0A183SA99_SCHSO
LLRKIKEESAKDKQMKESVRKFREETEKLEKSKEIQSMREFYKKIESEIPTDTVDKLRSQISSVAEKIKQEGANIAKHEYVKKGVEGLSKAGEQLKDASRSIGDTEFVKSARESISALEKELQSDRALVYRAPESSGVVLHKDSKWLSAWDDFKDNNQYVQKFFDLKTRYEESDHLLVRSVRFVTDKISDLFGNNHF